MNHFILQSLLLIAVAYFLGAIIGCWLRKIFQKSASMLHRESDELPLVAGAAATAVAGAPIMTELAGSKGEASITISRSPAPVEREAILVVEPETVPEIQLDELVVSPMPVPTAAVEPVIEDQVAPVISRPLIDDLTKIKGVGLPLALELKKNGITRFEQVANWSDADVAEISKEFGFSGRIERENWMDQAKILAAGDELEFTTHQLSEAERNSQASQSSRWNDHIHREELEKLSKPSQAPTSPPSPAGDDLKQVTGIGTDLEQRLNTLGINWLSQIAAWSDDDVVAISRQLNIPGRIEHENWIEQARKLGSQNS